MDALPENERINSVDKLVSVSIKSLAYRLATRQGKRRLNVVVVFKANDSDRYLAMWMGK